MSSKKLDKCNTIVYNRYMKLKDNKDSIIHIRTSYLEKKELIRKAKEQGFKDVSKFIRFKLELK